MPTLSFADLLAEIHAALSTHGYAYLPTYSPHDPTPPTLLPLARALGPLYVPPGCDPASPIIETHPTPTASYLTPFDRPEPLGWHNDFSTHTHRPAISLAYLSRPDPRGPHHGAWRVASTHLVIAHLRATPEGRDALCFLRDHDLPYSFTNEAPPTYFRSIEHRGLRFYGRTMRDGARLAYGAVPADIEHAIAAVEAAADHVGRTLAAPPGALLITDNWHALHDRLSQTVGDPAVPPRRSILCFVAALHDPPADRSASR